MTELAFRVEPTATPGDAPLGYELPRDGRVRLTVRLGARPTGGYAVEVTRVMRKGPVLTVVRRTREPLPGAMVTQALTSPAQTVSIEDALVRGIRTAVLVDERGAELARINA